MQYALSFGKISSKTKNVDKNNKTKINGGGGRKLLKSRHYSCHTNIAVLTLNV